MKFYTYITIADDKRHYLINYEYHKEKNKEIIKKLFEEGNAPDEIKFINSIPEDDFCKELIIGDEAGMKASLRCIMNDMVDENSALRKMLSRRAKPDPINDCLEVLEHYLNHRARNFLENKEKVIHYDVFYGDDSIDELDVIMGCKTSHFRLLLPYKIVEKYGGTDEHFFDLKNLEIDEILEYVAPCYYDDLGMWDREYIRNDEKKMAYLTVSWVSTLLAALA